MLRHIYTLFLSNFIGGLFFYVPIFALFLLGNDLTLASIVLGQMAYSIAAFCSEIPTGIIADRLGHHKSIAAGYFLSALALLAVGLFPSVAILLVAQVARGISGSLLSGSKEALLFEYGQQEGRSYKKDLSHLLSYQVLGFAISTLITGLVVQVYGQSSYWSIILISFCVTAFAGVVALTLPRAEQQMERIGRPTLYEFKECVKLFTSSNLLKTLLIVVALTQGSKFLLADLYQPYFELAGVAPFLLGAAISAGSVGGFIVIRNIYRLGETAGGTRLALSIVAAATAVLYVAFGTVIGPVATVVIFVLLFSIVESTAVFVSDYANRHSPSPIRATALSCINFSQELFKTGYKAVIATLVGAISLSVLFAFYGLFLLLGAGLSYWLLGRAEKQTGQPKAHS